MGSIAALYARVSTLQQEQEATIESQVAAIEAFAQSHGYRLLKEFYFLDQAVSAPNWPDRRWIVCAIWRLKGSSRSCFVSARTAWPASMFTNGCY